MRAVRKRPLVSIVMAVFNQERFLRQAVESALFQKYENIEIVVVDDGSTDGTPHVLRGLKDTRIKIITLKRNVGLARARNIGLRKCRGAWIMFFDGDDLMCPDAVAKMMRFLLSGRRKKAAFGYVRSHIDRNGSVIRVPRRSWLLEVRKFGSFFKRIDYGLVREIFPFFPCLLPSLIFHRSVFKKLGYLDENLKIEDTDYLIRMSKITPLYYADVPVFQYRYHKNSLARKITAADGSKLRQKHFGRRPGTITDRMRRPFAHRSRKVLTAA